VTEPASEALVSRARYEREKRARVEAEVLLEAKSRELFDANQRLIIEAETVRTALSETEALRQREAMVLKEQTILTGVLTALSGKSSADEAMQALLEVLQVGFGIADAFFAQAHGREVRLAAAARPESTGLVLPVSASILARPRRLASLAAVAPGNSLPRQLDQIEAVLITPLALPEEQAGALVLCCHKAGRFSAGDLKTLERVAQLAAQALHSLREARRNALLVSLIEGKPVSDSNAVLDAPLEAIHRAFGRMTDMQGQVVGILDGLLGAPLSEADAGIDSALARMGEITGVDRVYVFRLRSDGAFIDNTHEWCAHGIAAMREMLQDIPADMINHWRAAFDAGEDVLIPDVAAMPDAAPEKAVLQEQGIQSLLAVPILNDGQFAGFVGYDAVQTRRRFLPGEVYLIRSVAKVIASVLARRDAETRLFAAHAENLSQRSRLEAVLSAMPDLVVELDRAGRFVAWHSGAIVVPEPVAASFSGRSLDEALPTELASEARGVLAELDAGARTINREFRYTLLGDWERIWQLSASRIGDRGYLFVMRDVTEAREQAAEIERLSEIARRTTNLVVVTDAARRIEWVNEAFVRTTGWQLDEVRGRNAGGFLQSEATDPATVARVRAALDSGEAVQAEVLNVSRDGREYWVALDIQPLRDASGALQGFMAVETDVTERREQAAELLRAAEAAAEARATLEAAVEALQDGFVLFDAQDRLVICNRKYREIYARSTPAIAPGASFESILRLGLENGEYGDAVGREEDWLADRLSRHHAAASEFEQQLADGRWLRIFEQSTPDGGRVGLRVDITALKLAEQRALADRSAAMEASQDGIAITDAEGRFLYMNKAHLALFGYGDDSEVIGRPWTILYGPAEAAWMHANAMPELARTGRWSGEVLGVSKDGAAVDQDVSLTLKEDGGFLCIARDMHDRRAEAAERERIRDELHLAQRREIVGQMAAGLAHDFNNLLAAISGSASLIGANADPGSGAALSAERIVSASGQAAELVKRLLTLGARQPERRTLDMRIPVAEAATLLRASLKAPAQLILCLPDHPVEVMADPSDILQVVLNLCVNARDAVQGSAGTITVAMANGDTGELAGPFAVGATDPGRKYLALSVSDTGPGMSPDLIGRIFKPYVSTKGDKGTGLGLSIVASVVTSNGGAVRLWSEPGRGTRFTIFWPVSTADQAAPAVPVEALTGRLDGRRILVADDQQEVLDVLTAFLEAAGAEVAPSTEPEDILAAIEADPDAWDLVVTDFDMPSMNGDALAAAVGNVAPELPVILVTALAGVAGRTGARFAAVLGKPVDRNALVQSAETAILRMISKES
jgi:PAS domain S-box-containing protein